MNMYTYANDITDYIVFRAGEQGRFWYAVLGGSLEVRFHAADTDNKVSEFQEMCIYLYIIFLDSRNCRTRDMWFAVVFILQNEKEMFYSKWNSYYVR